MVRSIGAPDECKEGPEPTASSRARLTVGTGVVADSLSAAPSPDAERRQLTVMFCDLVGSTALSTELDPEDLRDVIAAFQDRCRVAIERYEGFIARYMGDGLLVYFGYPQAHEDDAERAVRAGLDLLEAMPALNAELGNRVSTRLAVRVGVATGPVIVGDIIGEGAAEEAAVIGETPNLAARLQGVADLDELVVGTDHPPADWRPVPARGRGRAHPEGDPGSRTSLTGGRRDRGGRR